MVKECLHLTNQAIVIKNKNFVYQTLQKQKNKKHPCNPQFSHLASRTLSTSTICPRTTTPPPSSQLSSSKRVALMSSNPKSAEISTSPSIPLSSESTTLTSSKESSRTSATSSSSQSPAVLFPTAKTCSESIFPSCRSKTSLSERSTRP